MKSKLESSGVARPLRRGCWCTQEPRDRGAAFDRHRLGSGWEPCWQHFRHRYRHNGLDDWFNRDFPDAPGGRKTTGTSGTSWVPLDRSELGQMEAHLAAISQILDRTLNDPSKGDDGVVVPRVDLETTSRRVKQLSEIIKKQQD
ncbi:MAG: hypothetical protein ACE148_01095 [Vicinamibacterales bacterium]